MLALLSWLAVITSSVVLIRLVDIFIENGLKGVLKAVAAFLVTLPGIRALVRSFTQKEVKGFMKDTFNKDEKVKTELLKIPEKGNIMTCICEEMW